MPVLASIGEEISVFNYKDYKWKEEVKKVATDVSATNTTPMAMAKCTKCSVTFQTNVCQTQCEICRKLAAEFKPCCAWCGHCNPPFEPDLIDGHRVCQQCVIENATVDEPRFPNLMGILSPAADAHLAKRFATSVLIDGSSTFTSEGAGVGLTNLPRTTTGHEHDDIDHPDHPDYYNQHPLGVECIDIAEGFGFVLGNVIKYVWRAGLKPSDDNGVCDLEKAKWYLEREIANRISPMRAAPKSAPSVSE